MTQQQRGTSPTHGTIALVGSGEYLDAMNTTDTYLLATIGGASNAHVALLPTASGLEENGPTYWNNLGLDHFARLGVADIRATAIIDRASAHDPAQLELLQGANFFYLSGGNPQHTIETLRGSPAWDIITTAYQHGAILAGCSAGAMTMSRSTIAIRQMMAGEAPRWAAALAVVPNIVVFPHFDRMARFIAPEQLQSLISQLPPGVIAAGVDENTAFVRIETTGDSARWQVMGQQTVSLFEKDAAVRILHVGEEVMLASGS